MRYIKYTSIFCLAAIFLFASCNSSKTAQSEETASTSANGEMNNINDSISYAYGQNLGSQLMKQQADFDPESFREGMAQAMNGGELEMSEADVKALLVAFQNEMRSKQMAAQQRGNFAPGMAAPEISLPDPDGNLVSLSGLKGKYVLIDFWASWCKPCRLENPNVVRVYNTYKDKGFEILGVSLDRTKDAWVKAIDQDGLGWLHVSDLRFWNSAAAQTYKVSSIPYTVLVDPDGKILAERLRGPSLEAKLKEIFGG